MAMPFQAGKESADTPVIPGRPGCSNQPGEANVLIPGPESSPVGTSNDMQQHNGDSVCSVCTRELSRYTCPRCNARYCSAACYKKHSGVCTHEFFKNMHNTHLMHETVDESTKRKTEELLHRFNEDGQAIDDAAAKFMNDDGGGNTTDDESAENEADVANESSELSISEMTLQRLRLKAESGQPVDVSDLTERERKDFERAAASGALSREVEQWNPWWYMREAGQISVTDSGQPIVLDTSHASTDATEEEPGGYVTGEEGSGIPPLPRSPLPSAYALVRGRAPSPSVRWHLLEALCCYCMVQRYFNGDWTFDEAHAAAVLLRVSAALAAGLHDAPAKAASTSRSALRGCLERSQEEQLGLKPFSGTLALRDTCTLLCNGRGAVLAALEHIRRLFERQSSKTMGAERKRKRHEASQVERKLFFLQAYANGMGESDIRELTEKASAELDRLLSPTLGT